MDRKQHWENIYTTKELTEVSWYQPAPYTSLELVGEQNLPLDAAIIDIGGGDSFFPDFLFSLGYRNITVLDISAAAIERAKQRLGEFASQVKWIVSDVTEFVPSEKYDLWHDRAAFHFLTAEKDIAYYVKTAASALNDGGTLAIGTFSEQGPKKCSGIEITQYSETALSQTFESFEKIRCFITDHLTPFGTLQNFIFCTFKKA